jgi:hypothetical protein
MYGWMNPLAFLQTVIRVGVVWASFYGAGYLVESNTKIKKLLPLLPREISGILLLIILELPLSLSRVMNRTVTPILLILFAVPGLFLLARKVKLIHLPRKYSLMQIIGTLALLIIIVLNLTYASMPSLLFDDPLITYAVQPDRWLNQGRLFWLDETTFSGFPLIYEMIAVWPASLSSDRIDQLSILQVFQMTLLFMTLLRGMQIMRIKKKLWIPLTIIVLLCTMLYYWSSLAKTDTAAILFSTLALASAISERKAKTSNQYTSWFLMGLALATKQTAFLILVPFGLYKAHQFISLSIGKKTISLLFISFIPLFFAVRTMIHTGSPTYPVHQLSILVRDEWRLSPPPEEISLINNRSSEAHESSNYSIAKHIGIFLTSMEGILLIFLGGVGVALYKRDRSLLLFLPLIVSLAVLIVVLWPPWWGAKYSILLYPFIAILGVSIMQSYEKFSSVYLPIVYVISFVVPGFIVVPRMQFPASYRFTVAKSVLSGTWDTSSGYQLLSSTPEGMTYMWMNSAVLDDSRILSIHEEKRYFYNHEVYVGWRHPATQDLYLDNTLAEECAILDEVGIDYITFYRNDPCIYKMENRLEILDHIGQNDILEPVISVSGNYLVCRYNPPPVVK